MENKTSLSVLSNFENELKIAQENLKFAKVYFDIIEIYNNKEKYTFEFDLCGIKDTIEIFKFGRFRSCGELNVSGSDIKTYLRKYELQYSVNHGNHGELTLLANRLDKLKKLDSDRYWKITKEFEHLIQ